MGYHQVFEKKTRSMNIVRYEQLKRISFIKHAFKSVVLKSLIRSDKLPIIKKTQVQYTLSNFPKTANVSRLVSCCFRTGRSHMVSRKLLLSRMAFREYAHRGVLPYISKGSW